MDVEKTMQFILEQQAGQAAAIARHDSWLAEHEAALNKGERQISGMRKLIYAGLKIVGDIGQKQEQLASEMLELRALHREGEEKFQHLVNLLTKRNSNGH